MRVDLSLARLSWHRQLVVFAALALVATMAFWYTVDLPTRTRIAAGAFELAELERRTANSNESRSLLADLRQQVAGLQAAADVPATAKPSERNAAELLRILHEQATEENLHVTAFRPTATKARDGAPESSIALELEGTYHDFGVFLDRLRRLSQPIVVSGVSLRARQPPTPDGIIDIVCTIGGTASAVPPTPDSAPPPDESIGSSYANDVAGRRDPFVSLASRESVAPIVRSVAGPRPDGVAGLAVEDVVLKGIVRSRDAWVGMIASPSDRTYSVRAGDRLMDGQVLAVTRSAILLVQDADLAAGRPAPREIRKELRPETK